MYTKIENGKVIYNPLTTSFNGSVLEELLSNDHGSFKTISIEGRGLLEFETNSIDVPGRAGGYYKYSKKKVRRLVVTAKLTGHSDKDFRIQFQKLNRLLDVGEARISFSDEGGIFYIAVFESCKSPPDRKQEAILELNFLCFDPLKYKSVNPVVGNNVQYAGDYDTKPKITVTLTADGNELRLLHVQKQKYIRIVRNFTSGSKVEIDMAKRTIKLNDVSIQPNLDMVNSRFFTLSTGTNNLSINIAGTILTEFKEVYA
ncbi:TPA: distal tail protein Dit [Streptococcus suis]